MVLGDGIIRFFLLKVRESIYIDIELLVQQH